MALALGVTIKDLKFADCQFKDSVQNAWAEEFKYTKTVRYPQSRTWTEGLPVFVSGGGSACDFYQQALVDLFPPKYHWMTRQEQLPVPQDLRAAGVDERGFGRLAVAYGLSFDADDIGEITRPENIEDARQTDDVEREARDRNAVTKDMT